MKDYPLAAPGRALVTTTENGTVDVIQELVVTEGGRFLGIRFRVHENGHPVEIEEAQAIARELLEAHGVQRLNRP